MARWAGEMEFEFNAGSEAFVATDKVLVFLRNHLARGEVHQAARLYEDSGANCAHALLQEARSSSSNTQKAMAEMFLMARDFKSAAVVFELVRQMERAASLYEQGLDFENAARVFEAVGDRLRAAVCLERSGKVDAAINLYKQAGPSQAMAELLARQGRYYDAAMVYRHIFNLKAEIEMLRMVPAAAENRMPAVLRLAELLEQYNHLDQAIGLLLDTIRTIEAARFHLPMYSQLARLLENSGRLAEAAQVRARMQNQLTPGATPAIAAPALVPATPAETAAPAVPATIPATMAPARDPFANLVDPFGGKGGQGGAPSDAYTFLKDIPIFAELRSEDMRELYRACEEVNYGSGETIVEQGVPGRGLHVIIQGDVQVRRVDVTGDTVLARLSPGSYVGELSLLDSSPTSARVIAVGPVFCLFISAERFDEFIMSHDEAARRIYRLFARTLAERLRTANQRK